MNESIGTLFKRRRTEMRLSLRDAAARIGTGYGHLCQIENGLHTNLTIKTIRAAQSVYGITDRQAWSAVIETLEGHDSEVGRP